MDDAKPRSSSLLWRFVFALAAYIVIANAVRPIPEKCTNTSLYDRTFLEIFVPLSKLVFFYPGRLCSTMRCSATFTRNMMETSSNLGRTILSIIFAPAHFFHDFFAPMQMRIREMNGVKVWTYVLNEGESRSDAAVVFIHGGGFVFGSADIYDLFSRDLTESIRPKLVVNIEYRLAPETPFPGAVEDCETVVDWLMEHGKRDYGIDTSKIVVVGDSAGGNLATVLARHFSRPEKPHPLLGQVLIYPLVQLSNLQMPSYYRYYHEESDYQFAEKLAAFAVMYAGVDVDTSDDFVHVAASNGHVSAKAAAIRDEMMNMTDVPERFRSELKDVVPQKVDSALAERLEPILSDPDFAPLLTRDLSGHPPALIITCEYDFLRDEGILYAKRLEKAGVNTTWHHYEDGFHTVMNYHRFLYIGQRFIQDITNWTTNLIESSR